MRNNHIPANLEMNPARFYSLADALTSVSKTEINAIDVHLNNVAIHSEIETAKTTYENAKAFLAQIKSSEM